jgi:serine/threonine protein kinase
VVVADFGTAHFADEELFTLVETAPNTRTANVIYAAPEQKARGRRVDHRADIFALGLMLNEIFTGEVIHAPGYQKVATVASGYAWVDEIVAEMIDTDPNKRPQTIDAVKQLLVARQQDYVQRQRLSQIQHTVIPVGEEDDPLALQPPKLVDFEFEGNRLTLVVDRDVNQGWIQAFNTMNPGTAVLGKPPTAFHWSGRRATVSAQEYQVQPIINYFKDWMPIATTTYRQMRERERSTTAQREHAKLAAEQEEIQRQLRLKKNIKL